MLGAIIGGVAGALAAYLFTPRSGKEVRQQIQTKADEIKLEFDLAAQEKRDELEEEVRRLRSEN